MPSHRQFGCRSTGHRPHPQSLGKVAGNHNRYVAQLRETGEEQWISYGTNIETQVVYDLKADTEYQIRVIHTCGAIEGTTENTPYPVHPRTGITRTLTAERTQYAHHRK